MDTDGEGVPEYSPPFKIDDLPPTVFNIPEDKPKLNFTEDECLLGARFLQSVLWFRSASTQAHGRMMENFGFFAEVRYLLYAIEREVLKIPEKVHPSFSLFWGVPYISQMALFAAFSLILVKGRAEGGAEFPIEGRTAKKLKGIWSLLSEMGYYDVYDFFDANGIGDNMVSLDNYTSIILSVLVETTKDYAVLGIPHDLGGMADLLARLGNSAFPKVRSNTDGGGFVFSSGEKVRAEGGLMVK